MLNRKSLLCLVLTLMLSWTLCLCALAQATETAAPQAVPQETAAPEATSAPQPPLTPETVLATVNGQDVTYTQVSKYFNMMRQTYAQQMDMNDPEVIKLLKEVSTNYAVTERLILQKAHELGLDQFTEEQIQDFKKQADEAFEQAVTSSIPRFYTIEGEDAQRKAAEEYLNTNGFTPETVAEQIQEGEAYKRVLESVSGGIQVSDEDLRASYDQKVEEAKAKYAQDKGQFDMDSMYGAEIWYTPEGVRAVKHILVMMDQAQAAELKTVLEQLAGLPEGDAGRAELEKKKEELLVGIGPRLDEIQQKITAGEDFQALIDQYGEDPGMREGAPNRETGYYLNDATKVFEMPFTQAALALGKPGDVSEPVLASRGYHIIRYDHDVPSGPVDFETVKESLRAAELDAKKQQAESDALTKWQAEAKTELFLDRFTE